MSKYKNGKKINKKVPEDEGRRRQRESSRDRRIRQTAEAGLEAAKRRIEELLRLDEKCSDYLRISDCSFKLHDAEILVGETLVKASEFQRLVDNLVGEILEVELSIAGDSGIKDELLDERLMNMRQLLHAQPNLPRHCQIFFDFKRAGLRIRSDKWDTYMTNLERTRYPDGRPIDYVNGCVQEVKNQLEQTLRIKVALLSV